MDAAAKPTHDDTTSPSNGCEFGRRFSPRLHSNNNIYNASPTPTTHSSEGCSLQRRFSPRFHQFSPNQVKPVDSSRVRRTLNPKSHHPSEASTMPILIDSSPESSAQANFTPNLCETTQENTPVTSPKSTSDAPTKTPNLLSRDPFFQKRVSPRLQGDLSTKTQNLSASNGANPELHARFVDQFRTRLSPRRHQNLESKEQVDTPNESGIQRRFSPRLHQNYESKEQEDTSNESGIQRRFSPRLHQNYESKEQEDTSTVFGTQRRFSPRLHQNYESKEHEDTSNMSGIQRKFSPRLHQNHESKEQEEDTSNESRIQKRFSPRLHQNHESKEQKDTSNKSVMQRRLSPRLNSEGEKEKGKAIANGPMTGKRSHAESHPKGDLTRAKRSKHDHPKDDGAKMDFKHSHPNGKTSTANGESQGELTMRSKVFEKKAKGDGDAARDVAGKSIHARVKETLRIFNTYYLQFVQEEEERRKKTEIGKEKKSKTSKSKQEEVKRTSSRPDLKAVTKMREKKEILYPEKIIGHVPGIEVGYQFFSRAEMTAIGFHSHWLNGIDYIGECVGKRGGYGQYTFPVAVAIVMSGQYEDDLDNSDDIIYTGQGGHDLVGNKLQRADQLLVRGNLAMKNCVEQSVPVRVIRGHKSANSYSGKIYTYDGLYKIVDTWADKGQRGHLVYKYRLQRLEGQPKLTTNQVQFVRGCSSKPLSELPGLICRDISNGQEDISIPVTNIFDDATIDPEGFTYIKTIEIAESVNVPPNAAGCACKGNCTNPKTCACARLNGYDFPYVRRDGGRLVEAKDIVFECGPNCSCGPGCLNRISQRGIRYHLEVYRTPDKGWAVRSWDFIPSGALVCEYIGILRRTDEVDNISGNDFIFEIDCLHTMNEVEGRERRFGNVPISATNVLPKIDAKALEPEFCIDAASRGNVARFINHSCEPNLFVQCILSSHHDLRLARVVLFAADNIPPMQELTYDYGYALDSVIGPDGKVKVLPCFCGTSDCRKRLY